MVPESRNVIQRSPPDRCIGTRRRGRDTFPRWCTDWIRTHCTRNCTRGPRNLDKTELLQISTYIYATVDDSIRLGKRRRRTDQYTPPSRHFHPLHPPTSPSFHRLSTPPSTLSKRAFYPTKPSAFSRPLLIKEKPNMFGQWNRKNGLLPSPYVEGALGL